MITTVAAFVDYFEGVRARTRHFVAAVPADRVDWTPQAGEYTVGDIVHDTAADPVTVADVDPVVRERSERRERRRRGRGRVAGTNQELSARGAPGVE